MGHGKDWFDQTPQERAAGYAARMVLLSDLLVDVRLHRAEECEGYPLCPGPAAVEKVQSIPRGNIDDFITSCLARMADQDGEIESLRTALGQERDRVKTLGEAKAEAERDADAGWAAYRRERDAHGAPMDGQP